MGEYVSSFLRSALCILTACLAWPGALLGAGADAPGEGGMAALPVRGLHTFAPARKIFRPRWSSCKRVQQTEYWALSRTPNDEPFRDALHGRLEMVKPFLFHTDFTDSEN
jgi:hypothetical protein